jgi:hypothetical protein
MTASPLTDNRVILFNGPRHSGKDTAALYCQKALGASHFKQSKPLKAALKAFYSLTDAEVEHLESIKTQPSDLLFGKSYVEAQISLSEDWAKRFHADEAIFGKLAARRLRNRPFLSRLVVCSDSGFAPEALPIIDQFCADNVLLVRVHREGKTYAGDSRGYISLPGIVSVDIENNGTIEEYHAHIHQLAVNWLNSSEWFG